MEIPERFTSSYMRSCFLKVDEALNEYFGMSAGPGFTESPFTQEQVEHLCSSIHATRVVMHLLNYIGAGMKASRGGLPEAYRLFFDYCPEKADFEGLTMALPVFSMDKELQKALRHEIFKAEMLARLPMKFVERIVSAMSAEEPGALVEELLNLAEVVTRRVADLFSQTPTDDEVLQVYAVREDFYLEHAYEADKEAYEKWAAGIAKKNRRREGERRKALYRERLFNTNFLNEIAADLPSFEEPIPDGQPDEEWEQSLRLQALRELTGEDGHPDRDAVGRHLLRWREQLTDGDIQAYFRYVHMSAYIDGLQPRTGAVEPNANTQQQELQAEAASVSLVMEATWGWNEPHIFASHWAAWEALWRHLAANDDFAGRLMHKAPRSSANHTPINMQLVCNVCRQFKSKVECQLTDTQMAQAIARAWSGDSARGYIGYKQTVLTKADTQAIADWLSENL